MSETYLLDSSAIIDLLTTRPLGSRVAKAIEGSELCTSIICYCEVLNKISLQNESNAEKFLSKLFIFPVTLPDGKLAKKIQDSCRLAGRQVPTLDCIVAATAIQNNATLVATDKDFERIQQVKKIVLSD